MVALAVAALVLSAQPTPIAPDFYNCLEWRCIGPFRGGRTVGATGVADQPFTFYMGVNNGGVWKTNDAGRTWNPIFDDQPTGSIGDVAVAPSDPNVVYVGTGEGLQRPDLATGNGMYRSGDAGKTWTHLGLEDAQQVGGIGIDPKNADRVFVAALGHPYGPNETRGIYRSVDGGKNWKKVLYVDENTGAFQVMVDPNDSNVVYADMWEGRQGPWENGQWQGPGSGLYKSTDGGDNWTKLTQGLPTIEQGLGRIGFDIARSNSKILYATVDAGPLGGLFRSDDAGSGWTRVNAERRLISRGADFADVRVDPKDAETVYVCDTSFYRSTDGGKSFTCIKGSPGGDDYHRSWINPNNTSIIFTAADQGAAVSLNGGETWSSWYNQPTAQMYHVSTDNLFPYNVYSGQQESGSAMVSSRGNDGQITFREWHPAGGDEYGYLACDPLNPRFVYGGRISRYDKVTGLIEDVRPKGTFRTVRTAPVVFSTVDKRALYFAGNTLFRTRDGGEHWDTISPDLSRETWEIPPSVGKYATDSTKVTRRGVIYTVAPSYIDKNVIWCGTDDGLIWVTKDSGKHWSNVTPPVITAWSKISIMDAGHFDKGTAYAAVNRIRCDDQNPHIYATHDWGQSWTEIVNGLPPAPINVVREDWKQKGLLFCGSETNVSFSVDDGRTWQALRNNMPATSVRDLVIHEDDLVIGTHGRGFWILDNFSLLRSLAYQAIPGEQSRSATPRNLLSGNRLYPPPTAYLLNRNTNSDTPLPPEEPHGKNPPDGVTIDYYVVHGIAPSKGKLEILDKDGKVIRSFSSEETAVPVDPTSITVMPEWVRPQQILSVSWGSHRFIWDLKTAPPAEGGGRRGGGLPISAVWHDTPIGAQGEFVKPGVYTVRLTVDGGVMEQKLTVKPDPRGGKGKAKGIAADEDEP